MKYFFLDGDDACIGQAIVGMNGQPLFSCGPFDKYWEVTSGEVQVPFLDSDRDIRAASELPDIIPVDLELVLSNGLLAWLLESFNVAPHLQNLPVNIVNRKKRILTSEFRLIYAQQWSNVIAVEPAKAKLFPTGHIDVIDKWILDRKLIPPFEVFRAHDQRWIVTERVGEGLVQKGFKNIRLESAPAV